MYNALALFWCTLPLMKCLTDIASLIVKAEPLTKWLICVGATLACMLGHL